MKRVGRVFREGVGLDLFALVTVNVLVLSPATEGYFWDGPRSFGLQSDADTQWTSVKLPIRTSWKFFDRRCQRTDMCSLTFDPCFFNVFDLVF
ncbi:hypothetical protein AVEN_243338-1 [Araneus ventricosus]|uniref:Uncharacterized protein n=1 Tax=Araneus ventricosus TaxID=182803 RepID=A0A4Y2HBC7_ARAVE|nr:hypothetical protein AVEN_243338-1 [Araneus ventricosus]